MPTINLLPEEFSTKGVVKIARLIKKVLIPIFAIFFMSLVVMLGIIVILNSSLRRIRNSQEQLTTSIKNLERTERGMLLLQERLAKVKLILPSGSSKDKFTQNIQDILGRSPGVNISEIKLVSDKINLTAEVATSDQIEEFLAQVLENPLFKAVKLTGFSFSPAAGYRLDLDLATK